MDQIDEVIEKCRHRVRNFKVEAEYDMHSVEGSLDDLWEAIQQLAEAVKGKG